MKTSSFRFDLPEELIAQYPPVRRGGSRMLVLDRDSGALTDTWVKSLPGFIDHDTHLVFNNSRVRKARLYGTSEHGGRVEFLLIEHISACEWKAVVSRSKRQRPGKQISMPGRITAEITGTEGELRTVLFSREVDDAYLDRYGHIPLPPYIRREDISKDSKRYQTIFADQAGSAAAPTAGLHFTGKLMRQLGKKAAGISYVTLHVGLGTFRPIRVEELEDHRMHAEEYEISEQCAAELNLAKKQGKKILAVGTTSVRTLESATQGGEIIPGKNSTDLFIVPGYSFRFVDLMFTNFHTPDSSLIVMVNAFAGMDNIRKAYVHAVSEKYRFFSYGDAMLIK
ncbi:MAG: tRNA preQ1(34) S-adenosylmethionine ribosyltransferase-isomerase QueA [Spirochaetales bacterium]|nr:tRNA preQ1(34) S-adenosylmethionine ribosyltransferase-isomerase QueA [Spirochaetales bacterium]